MSIDLTGAQVIQGIFSALLLCLAFFVRQWMTRLQADLDSAKKKHTELEDKFNEHKLQCLRDFAQKAEISNGRAEMMEAIHTVAAKVDRLFDKLDTKADKT